MANNANQHEERTLDQHRTQKLESLGILASGVAHDFNNLLTSMLSQTSLALAKLPADDPARPHLEKVLKAAERATGLTKQLMTYARGGNTELEPIDLNQVVSDNVELFEIALKRGSRLHMNLAPELPVMKADAGQMQQVVMNLVINAAEAIQSRGGSITIVTGTQQILSSNGSGRWAGVTGLPPGNYVYLQVTDTGVGIDRETLSHIFDPFFTTKANGKGLGLSTTLEIVRAHQGGLTVESELGRGTTFKVLFPYNCDEH